jgi:hypothetical protein
MKGISDTFHTFASRVLKMITDMSGRQCTRIDFVGDRYRSISVRGVERERRSTSGDIRVKILAPDQKCPKQWLKYLNNGQNKEELLNFLSRNGRLVALWRNFKVIKCT